MNQQPQQLAPLNLPPAFIAWKEQQSPGWYKAMQDDLTHFRDTGRFEILTADQLAALKARTEADLKSMTTVLNTKVVTPVVTPPVEAKA